MNHNSTSPCDHPPQSQYTGQNSGGLCLVTNKCGHGKHANAGVRFATVCNPLGAGGTGAGGGIFQ
jgi:hypothetical protein